MNRICGIAIILFAIVPPLASADEYYIVLPDNPSRIISRAANELSKYIGIMTDGKVSISNSVSGIGINFIIGGPDQNRLANNLLISDRLVEPASLNNTDNDEAYYIQSAGNNIVVIAGKSDIAILYAVYDYLQRFGSCGFFEDGEYIPRKSPQTKNVSFFSEPRLRNREFHADLCGAFGLKKFHFAHRDADDWIGFYDWLSKRRMNMSGIYAGINSVLAGDAVEMAFGVKVDDTPGEQYGAGWPTGWTWNSKVRTRLLKKRIAYAHNVGLRTYWYCMYGHCPVAFKKLHPELKWVPSNYDHALLHPDEPLASELTAKFYKAVIDLYGTDHFYTDTPYCESMGAGNEDESLKLKIAAANKACDVFRSIDSNPTWVSDSWDFGALPSLWTSERKKKYFESIPRDMSYFFDATVDMNPFYASTNYFYGLPWGVGNLHSFQGDDHLHGNLDGLISAMKAAESSPGGNTLNGYFNLPEIHGANIIYWQLSTLLAWDPRNVTLESYLRDFTLTRYGEESYPQMRKAVDALVKGVYSGQNYQPMYKKIGCPYGPPEWWPIVKETDQSGASQLPGLFNTITYLNKAMEYGLDQEDLQIGNMLYENDMVDWSKSYLAHMFNYCMINAHEAFKAGNASAMKQWGDAADSLLLNIEMILSTRPDFSLQKTIDETMSVPGTNPSAPAMIRQQCINDLYAVNDVYEQIHHFYRPRTKAYLDELYSRAEKGLTEISYKDIQDGCNQISKRWLDGPIDVPAAEHYNGTAMDAVKDAYKSSSKIFNAIKKTNKPVKK